MASRALLSTTRLHAIKQGRPILQSAIAALHHHHHQFTRFTSSYSAQFIPRIHSHQKPHQKRTKATLSGMSSTNDFAKALKALHKPGQPLIVSNVWDAPSLNTVASLNDGDATKPVKAFATASWALANARGLNDEDLSADQNLEALRELAPLAAKQY
ncbi:hypothetical protein NLG97_g8958 [Lecanicillium saksenae]|uniref:Uncharacterized protein n=1 Tax=Lecanicillium saksenae TaxID=468837 RepID=A0ACC1QHD0_9HYPO|nr:hypothetical protein NLG97_g8958 [Lecanicillium saksenae]